MSCFTLRRKSSVLPTLQPARIPTGYACRNCGTTTYTDSLDATLTEAGTQIDGRHVSKALRRILDYEIPVVRMVDHSFDDAVRAFTRINTLGVRLKKEDIESAQVAV